MINLVYHYNDELHVKTSKPVICFDKLYVGVILIDTGTVLIYNLKDGRVVFRSEEKSEAKCKRVIKDQLIKMGCIFEQTVRV